MPRDLIYQRTEEDKRKVYKVYIDVGDGDIFTKSVESPEKIDFEHFKRYSHATLVVPKDLPTESRHALNSACADISEKLHVMEMTSRDNNGERQYEFSCQKNIPDTTRSAIASELAWVMDQLDAALGKTGFQNITMQLREAAKREVEPPTGNRR